MTPGIRRLLTASLFALLVAAPIAALTPQAQAPTWPVQPTRNHQEGEHVTILFRASNHVDGATSYSASNLPLGLTINSSTGLVEGDLTSSNPGTLDGSAGTRQVTITATNAGGSTPTEFTWHVSRFRKGDVFAGIGGGRYQVFDENGNFKYMLTAETEAEWLASGAGWGVGTTTGCGYNWVTRKMYFTSFDVDNDPHVIEINPVPAAGGEPFPRNRISTFRSSDDETGGAVPGASVDNAPESVVFDGQGNMYVGHAGGLYNENWDVVDMEGRIVATTEDGWFYYYVDADGNYLTYTEIVDGAPVERRVLFTAGVSIEGYLERWNGMPYPGNLVALKQGGRDLQKFTRNAGTGQLERTDIFATHKGWQGTDWIDLASDQATMFYTSEWGDIYRYNVGPNPEGADRQLTPYVSLPPAGNTSQVLYALRLLPPGDGDGGLLVATSIQILRIAKDGRIVMTYDANADSFFGLNISPDGKSLWSAATDTGKIYKWDIASGRPLLLGPQQTMGVGTDAVVTQTHEVSGLPTRYSLDGLCVMGEYTAAQEICGNLVDDDGDGEIDEICQPIEACTNSSPGDDDGDGLVDSNDPDCGAEDICTAGGYTDPSIAGYCARHNYEGDTVTLLPAPGPPAHQGLRETFQITGSPSLPPGITFDSNAVATGTPAYTTLQNTETPNTRTYQITVAVERRQVSDDALVSKYSHKFNWTIENKNRAPIATPHTLTTRPSTAVAVNVLTDGTADSDPDTEDTITVTSRTNPANGTVTGTGAALTYTPNPGFLGQDSFTYTITDNPVAPNPALSSTATVTIDVVNRAPVVVPDAVQTRPGLAVQIPVLANDSDPDGDTFTITSNTSPAHGAVTVAAGIFTYTSTVPYTGTDTFTYTVTDQYGATATGTVTITIVNQRPIAVDDATTMRPGQTFPFAVLANDSDPDNSPDVAPAGPDPMTITAFTQPLHGTVTQSGSTLTYTHSMTPTVFVGVDTFTYSIADSFGGTATATVRVTIVNTPPVAVDDSATTRPGQAVSITVLGNDTDADSDTLAVTANTSPANGTVTRTGNVFTYAPNAGYVGTDSFEYTISDGFGGTDTAVVTITSNNRPPVAVDDSASMIAGGSPITIAVRANDPADPDGDTVTITAFTQPANGSVVKNANDTFTFTPANGFSGVTTFTYTIADGFGGTSTATVTINVVNQPPVARDDSATTAGTRPVAIPVMVNDSDPDNHVIAVTGATTPANGAAVVNANGTITYTANTGFQGTDTFFYTIRDGFGGTSTATVTITVGPPNRFDPCVCATAKASPGVIWPPNHKQTEVVNVTNLVDPDGGPLTIKILGIYQDEPTNYLGDGETTIDAGGVGTSTAWVRAERTGNPNVPGNGRVYEIVFEATAQDGSTCQGSIFTGVPHDQGQGNVIQDDGIRYDSTVAGGPIVRNALTIENNLSDADVTAREFTAKYVAEARIGGGGAVRELLLGPASDLDADSDHFNWTTGEDVFFLLSREGSRVEFRLLTSTQTESVTGTIDCPNGECSDIFIRAQSGGTGRITLSQLTLNGRAVAGTLESAVGADAASLHLSGLWLDEGMRLGGVAKIEWTGTRPADAAVNFRIQVGEACPTEGGSSGGGSGTPPLARTDSYATQEDVPLTVSAADGVLQNDLSFAGSLTAAIVDATSNGTLSLNANGSFTYTPNPGFNGQDTFRYRVNDGSLYSAPALVTIQVVPVLDPPAAADDSATTSERVPVTIAVLGNDTDAGGGAVSLASLTQPSRGSAVISGSSIVYTPTAGFIGLDTFTYTVQGAEGTDTATVTVNVVNVNEAPAAVNDAYSTQEDTPLTISAAGVKGNDSDPDAGDTLSAVLVTGPGNGTLSLNANGSFTYTPGANFNGTDTFTYRVRDAGGLDSNVATVTITVTAVNDPPVAVNDSYVVSEDSALQINAPGVKQNDTDPDTAAENLTITLLTGVQRGTLTLTADGSFLYTPLPNVSGSDSFTYRLSDGNGSSTGTATIAITEVNDGPSAADDAGTTQEDSAVTIAVLPNDSDPDGSPLTLQGVTQPANGTAAVTGTQVRYTPAPNFSGTDTFTYTISDGTLTASAKVVVTVTPVNDPPTAIGDSYSTPQNTPLNVQTPGVLGNDSDPDQQNLTAQLVSQAAHGTVTLQAQGAFSYNPEQNYTGTDTFTYKVTDGTGESQPVVVTITVTASNRPPVAANDTYSTARNTPLTMPAPGVLQNDSDPDTGDTLTVTLISGTAPNAGTVTVNPNGSFTFTPADDYTGQATFRYRAVDNQNAQSNEAIATITVSASNRPPVASDDTYTAEKNTPLTVAAPGVLGDDSDPDSGDTITASLVSGPPASAGTLTLNANGGFTFTPANNYTGTTTFRYRARDNHDADSGEATVSIEVKDVQTSGQVCYDGGLLRPDFRAYLDWNVLESGDVRVRATVSRNYADNTYGVNKIGWGARRHEFDALYRSDYGRLAFYDANGAKRLDFRIDYLSPLAGTPSGYGSRGVAGGQQADGGMVTGSVSDIVSMATSIDLNMNAFGYVSASPNHPLKTYSPPTNASYAVNATYPLWIWDVWYEATVKGSAFGSAGFGYPRLAALHASPAKADIATWRLVNCQ